MSVPLRDVIAALDRAFPAAAPFTPAVIIPTEPPVKIDFSSPIASGSESTPRASVATPVPPPEKAVASERTIGGAITTAGPGSV